MRGVKLVVFLLLLGVTLGNWIQENSNTEKQIQMSKPQLLIEQTQQQTSVLIETISDIDFNVPAEPVPAPPLEVPTEPTSAQETAEEFNHSLDPFDHYNRMPDEHVQRHHHHRRQKGPRHHKDGFKQHQMKGEQQPVEEDESQFMLMNNQVVMLAVLVIICVGVIGICTKEAKCRRIITKNCAVYQEYPQKKPYPQPLYINSNENAAIDESIRYHERQIMRLRSIAALQMQQVRAFPTYMANM